MSPSSRSRLRATLACAAVVATSLTTFVAVPASAGGHSSVVSAMGSLPMQVVPVNSGNVDSLIAQSKTTPVVFNITAPAWCGACQQLDPVIKGMAASAGGKWILAEVDVDKAPAVKGRFNVQAYPTLVPYVGGREATSVSRSVGFPGESGLRTWINKVVAAGGNNRPVNPQPTLNPNPNPVKPMPNPTSVIPTPTLTPKPVQPNPVKPNPGNPDPINQEPVKPQPTLNPEPGGDKPVEPNPGGDKPVEPNPGGGHEGVTVITDKNYDSFIEMSKTKPVVLDFSKDGCDPCAKLAPVLHEKLTADAGKWALGTLDGTAYKDLWAKYDNPWFPTLIVIRDGKEFARHPGYDGNKEEIVKWLDQALFSEEKPHEDPKVMDATTMEHWKLIYSMSKRHPVAIRLHMDDFFGEESDRAALAEMANGDGGKWTLANVPVFSPGGVYFAVMNKTFNFPTTLVFYNGKVHLEPLSGSASKEDMRSWVNTMLSTKYPVDGEEPNKPKPETPEPGTKPEDGNKPGNGEPADGAGPGVETPSPEGPGSRG